MTRNKTYRPLVVALLSACGLSAQNAPLPNPYRVTEPWAKMPDGRTWGSTSAVDIDRDGNIWVAERCGANSCATSTLPAILEFDRSGKLLKSFGAGMFVFPHGIYVDHENNVWVTDGQGANGKGQQVFKFSPEGKVLLTLGKAGVAGDGPDTFNQPSDVVVGANGDIFVADGHGGNTNARIVKFSKDGKFIKSWGKKGTGPGEFDTPHALAIDSKGRLFVGDRANNRIQIFDQDGKFLDQWMQFSRPSGLFIDKNDILYVADSESNTMRHPGGWKRGIRVGSAKDGTVRYFIPDPEPEPDRSATSGAEGVAADADGSIYGAEVGPKALKRYAPVGEPKSEFFTTSDGVKIHYLTMGDKGSWVVLIHGFTDTAQRMFGNSGIMIALAKNHRVVALDNRNHGLSDKPQPNGLGRAEDAIELMDHLKIKKAHIHGYSMGGAFVGQLLAKYPDRFITAEFGGSGIQETDPKLREKAAAMDKPMPPPQGAEAAAFNRLKEIASAGAAGKSGSAGPPSSGPVDLTKIKFPVLAINGEFDSPHAKTERMARELRSFQNVILPGKNHMSAIAVGGPMPQQYIDTLVAFINVHDQK